MGTDKRETKEKVRNPRIVIAAAVGTGLLAVLFQAGVDGRNVRENLPIVGKIEIERIEVRIEGLPSGFDGFRIAHLSDLHQRRFGNGQEGLLAAISAADPDLILLTGDILDMRDRDTEPVKELLEGIAGVRPAFAVTGNHEQRTPLLTWLEDAYRKAGIRLLRNQSVRIARSGGTILVAGIDDPDFSPRGSAGARSFVGALDQLKDERREGEPLLLLSHRPERIADYADAGVDLAFSGHAHGGQIRLSSIPGLFAPDQGFFPRYTSGRYRSGNTFMVVSRGLANTVPVPRIGNRFHLPLVVLQGGTGSSSVSAPDRSEPSR